MASCDMIFISSFMRFSIGVQELFVVSLSSLRICNVGIIRGKNE
jgi:hypothetical protein